MPKKPAADGATPNDYFASERTLLAWVRTGLAMMGFGFVVARFGLFLREMAAARGGDAQHALLHSLWFGVALILFGVVVTLGAAVGHWKTIKRLDRGELLEFKPLSLAIITAVVLAVLGLGLTAYFAFGFYGEPVVKAVAPAGEINKTPATPGR